MTDEDFEKLEQVTRTAARTATRPSIVAIIHRACVRLYVTPRTRLSTDHTATQRMPCLADVPTP